MTAFVEGHTTAFFADKGPDWDKAKSIVLEHLAGAGKDSLNARALVGFETYSPTGEIITTEQGHPSPKTGQVAEEVQQALAYITQQSLRDAGFPEELTVYRLGSPDGRNASVTVYPRAFSPGSFAATGFDWLHDAATPVLESFAIQLSDVAYAIDIRLDGLGRENSGIGELLIDPKILDASVSGQYLYRDQALWLNNVRDAMNVSSGPELASALARSVERASPRDLEALYKRDVEFSPPYEGQKPLGYGEDPSPEYIRSGNYQPAWADQSPEGGGAPLLRLFEAIERKLAVSLTPPEPPSHSLAGGDIAGATPEEIAAFDPEKVLGEYGLNQNSSIASERHLLDAILKALDVDSFPFSRILPEDHPLHRPPHTG
jgi:hypothetical protein